MPVHTCIIPGKGGGGGRGYAGNSTMQAMHALHALHTTFYNQVPATQAGDPKSLKLSTEGAQSAVNLAWA